MLRARVYTHTHRKAVNWITPSIWNTVSLWTLASCRNDDEEGRWRGTPCHLGRGADAASGFEPQRRRHEINPKQEHTHTEKPSDTWTRRRCDAQCCTQAVKTWKVLERVPHTVCSHLSVTDTYGDDLGWQECGWRCVQGGGFGARGRDETGLFWLH